MELKCSPTVNNTLVDKRINVLSLSVVVKMGRME